MLPVKDPGGEEGMIDKDVTPQKVIKLKSRKIKIKSKEIIDRDKE